MIYDIRRIAAIQLEKQRRGLPADPLTQPCPNDSTKIWILTTGGYVLMDKQKLLNSRGEKDEPTT
jgi:hypothetical protein